MYTKGTEGNPSKELRDMLKYFENTKGENVTNQDIDTIHRLVQKVKHRKEVGIRALITTLREMPISREDTLAKLIQNFSLSSVDAAEYMNKYWQ